MKKLFIIESILFYFILFYFTYENVITSKISQTMALIFSMF